MKRAFHLAAFWMLASTATIASASSEPNVAQQLVAADGLCALIGSTSHGKSGLWQVGYWGELTCVALDGETPGFVRLSDKDAWPTIVRMGDRLVFLGELHSGGLGVFKAGPTARETVQLNPSLRISNTPGAKLYPATTHAVLATAVLGLDGRESLLMAGEHGTSILQTLANGSERFQNAIYRGGAIAAMTETSATLSISGVTRFWYARNVGEPMSLVGSIESSPAGDWWASLSLGNVPRGIVVEGILDSQGDRQSRLLTHSGFGDAIPDTPFSLQAVPEEGEKAYAVRHSGNGSPNLPRQGSPWLVEGTYDSGSGEFREKKLFQFEFGDAPLWHSQLANGDFLTIHYHSYMSFGGSTLQARTYTHAGKRSSLGIISKMARSFLNGHDMAYFEMTRLGLLSFGKDGKDHLIVFVSDGSLEGSHDITGKVGNRTLDGRLVPLEGGTVVFLMVNSSGEKSLWVSDMTQLGTREVHAFPGEMR